MPSVWRVHCCRLLAAQVRGTCRVVEGLGLSRLRVQGVMELLSPGIH